MFARLAFCLTGALLWCVAGHVCAQGIHRFGPEPARGYVYPHSLRPGWGGLNFSTGAVPQYVGGGQYEYGPTTLYHPYLGWYRLPASPVYVDLAPHIIVPAEINRRPPGIEGTSAASPAPPTSGDLVQARRLLEFGDARFAEGQFAEALRRYRAAAELTPDVAELHFRKGFAAAATRQFDVAAEAFRRGMVLAPNWERDYLKLDQLYAGNVAAKTKHLEAISAEALKKGNDQDLMLVVGMFLFCDGQAERAQKYLPGSEPSLSAGERPVRRTRPRPHIGGEW